jgi:hypothetical protein
MEKLEYMYHIDRLKSIVSELVRMDISYFRLNSKRETGKYQHEPSNYANELAQIYTNMQEDDLIRLYELKTKKTWKN